MESVSSTVHFAVLSASVAAVTRGRCRPARAVTIPITSPWPAARSTRPCAFIVAWPNRILTSSAHVHTIISSIHSRKSGVCAKPRKPSAKFMARLLRANSPCSQPSGPTVTNPNLRNAKSSSNGSMKITRPDSLSPSDRGEGRGEGYFSAFRSAYRFHTDFIPILKSATNRSQQCSTPGRRPVSYHPRATPWVVVANSRCRLKAWFILSDMPQSLSQVILHIIFSTKDRRPWLNPAIRPRMHAYLATVCRDCGCEAYRVGGVADHVHIAARLARTITQAELLEKIKNLIRLGERARTRL